MEFKHIEYSFPKLVRDDSNKDYRLYSVVGSEDKVSFPSVTSVTSLYNREGIQEWRNRVGEEEANRISKKATKRGEEIHFLCEKLLRNEEIEADLMNLEMWNDLKPVLENNINNIMGLECALYSNELNVAGTLDCLAEFDGVPSIIDFKTSRRPKSMSMTYHYFMQMSAYAQMVKEHFDMDIKNLVVVMGVDEHEPIIFEEKNSENLLQNFKSLREKFKKEYGF